MASPVLIYCAGNNPTFDNIASTAGFQLGVQLPNNKPSKAIVYFVDQNWKNPDRTAYISAIAKHQPYMATVLDLEHKDQLDEVLSWAEEVSQYVKQVVIIPKVFGIISELPKGIRGAQVVLGYSVPTRYGGTSVPIWEFSGWPIHLLGGNPKKQYELSRYLDVISVDGNYANMCATKFCKFFDGRTWHKLKNDDGELWGKDAPYECFRRSCNGVVSMWAQHNKSLHSDQNPP